MLRLYARFALFVIGLIAAVALFAFAFTAAAIVALIGLTGLVLFARPRRAEWTMARERTRTADPLIIEHDPNAPLRDREPD